MSSNSKNNLQWSFYLVLLLMFYSTCVYAREFNIPRLGAFQGKKVFQQHKNVEVDAESISISDDFQTFFYPQTLDHFNYQPQSYATFQQKFVISFKYWGGANASAPILAYLGEEAPLAYETPLYYKSFFNDLAIQFNALQVLIEHRFYGDSIPYGSSSEAAKNASLRGYFSSAQAIADYAEVLQHVKKNLSAETSPVIVVGGSYGGMLASWFRLKYPHIAFGALASSAPILYFDDIVPENKGYYSVVTKDFREESESCYETIRKSWSEIDKVGSEQNGLSILSQRFNSCSPLNNTSELKDFLDTIYTASAQYDDPIFNPVNLVCGGINGASYGNDTLSRIYAGVVALFGSQYCLPLPRCTEMVMPIGIDINDTMFPPHPFNLTSFTEVCMRRYGVPPRPHWVTTYFGGHDIMLILERFGSNIIFSNGLKDPYSCGGVLENISATLLAIYTEKGSHCLDLHKPDSKDPEWLVSQRKKEIRIIRGWFAKYYAQLQESKH
ncbi:Peptidase S28 [Dillenia turbinata]|uniref:Peptidase S28 n=1 Tax=Dillenia turbinata TaxID=194707 RepID=A0AAN8VFJ5_9MAGN